MVINRSDFNLRQGVPKIAQGPGFQVKVRLDDVRPYKLERFIRG
jgi:hypothetical protein